MVQLPGLSRGRRWVAITIGAVLLVGTAGALVGYLNRFGLDGLCGYLLACGLLSAIFLLSGVGPRPPLWRALRLTFALLSLANLFVLTPVLYFSPAMTDEDAAGLLVVANFLIALSMPSALVVGAPEQELPHLRVAEYVASQAGSLSRPSP